MSGTGDEVSDRLLAELRETMQQLARSLAGTRDEGLDRTDRMHLLRMREMADQALAAMDAPPERKRRKRKSEPFWP